MCLPKRRRGKAEVEFLPGDRNDLDRCIATLDARINVLHTFTALRPPRFDDVTLPCPVNDQHELSTGGESRITADDSIEGLRDHLGARLPRNDLAAACAAHSSTPLFIDAKTDTGAPPKARFERFFLEVDRCVKALSLIHI